MADRPSTAAAPIGAAVAHAHATGNGSNAKTNGPARTAPLLNGHAVAGATRDDDSRDEKQKAADAHRKTSGATIGGAKMASSLASAAVLPKPAAKPKKTAADLYGELPDKLQKFILVTADPNKVELLMQKLTKVNKSKWKAPVIHSQTGDVSDVVGLFGAVTTHSKADIIKRGSAIHSADIALGGSTGYENSTVAKALSINRVMQCCFNWKETQLQEFHDFLDPLI